MSDNVVQGPESWRANIAHSLEPDPEPPADLAGGGGPPHNPGMEARVTALEANFGDVRAILARLEPMLGRVDDRTRKIETDVTSMDGRLRKIETDTLPKLGSDLARLDGRVSQLPTALTVFAYMGGLVTLSMALFGAAIAALKYLGH